MAIKTLAPEISVYPIEPEFYDDVGRSLVEGEVIANPKNPPPSLCDAILTPQACARTFEIIQQLCPQAFYVTDQQVLHAMALAFQYLKLVTEPGGAVALAAALFIPEMASFDTLIVVISGGNVEASIFEKVLQRANSHDYI